MNTNIQKEAANKVRSKIDMPIGSKFGKLTVMSQPDSEHRILVRCDCGTEKMARKWDVFHGRSKSCGCSLQLFKIKDNAPSSHPLYNKLMKMKRRCYNPKAHDYKRYGGRGIKICEEWLNSREAFYDWALSNGWKKGLQIDRINNDGNYEPSNCRFVTIKVNSRNSRATKINEQIAANIRDDYRRGMGSFMKLGGKYNLSGSTVGYIVTGKTWN